MSQIITRLERFFRNWKFYLIFLNMEQKLKGIDLQFLSIKRAKNELNLKIVAVERKIVSQKSEKSKDKTALQKCEKLQGLNWR